MSLWDLTDLATPWCVHVAATLCIADHIAAGISTIDQLAAAAGADRDSLHRVLRHLVAHGVFEQPSAGHFALNQTARGLLDPAARAGLDLDAFGGRMAGAWSTLLQAVRTGRPAYHKAFGHPFWEDLDAHPHLAAAFDELMGPGHGTPDHDVLANPADWDGIRTVVDVGGGTGYLLAEVLRAHPEVRGTLVDLPRTVARAAPVFAAAGVSARATVVGQSFFDSLPSGADLYLLKSVLSDWPDGEATAILARCAEAAGPSSGRIVAFNSAGQNDPEASPELLMMVLVGGRARTVPELTALAREAGLEFRAVHRQQNSGRSTVEFRPVAGRSTTAQEIPE
jgi:2,7-dihydroxy-5-methyl-1-naphthoate 7-O-methyltransferase